MGGTISRNSKQLYKNTPLPPPPSPRPLPLPSPQRSVVQPRSQALPPIVKQYLATGHVPTLWQLLQPERSHDLAHNNDIFNRRVVFRQAAGDAGRDDCNNNTGTDGGTNILRRDGNDGNERVGRRVRK